METTEAKTNHQEEVIAKQRQLEESDLLLNLYRTVIESTDLSSGFCSALELVCQFTGWIVGTAWLPSADETQLGLCSSWHRDDPKLAEFVGLCQQRLFSRDVDLPGRVWHRKKPERTRNLAAEPAELFPLAPAAAKAGIEAAFAVPIIYNHQVDGVLMFHAREAKEEDDRLIQVLSRIATPLGFALHHKRIEEVKQRPSEVRFTNNVPLDENKLRDQGDEKTRERVRQQEAIADLGRQAVGGAALAELLRMVTELVAEILGVEFCKVLELLPGKDALLLRAGVGWQEGLVGQVTVSAGTNSQAGYTLLCKEPVIVNDLRTEERFNDPPLLRDHGVVSGISVIIGRSDRPFGVLGAHTAKARAFSRDDIHFLQAAANVLSQVIEHDRALEEIRRNVNWLERLIGTTQDAVLSIDRQGRVVLFNPAAERIFGYTRDEVIGQKVNMLMAEPYATEHDEYIARYESTGEARAIGRIRTVTAQRKNGEPFPIELSVTEIAVDQYVHYAAFIRDISETTRLQEQLMESGRLAAIGTTAAKIGHELANPLNGISLTIQLLEQRLSRMADGSGSHLTPTIKRLKDEISRLQKLVGQFATISRKERYVFRPVNLPQLIDDIVALQAPHLAQHGIEIQTSLAPDLTAVNIDRDKIKQALLNLVKNAGEAMSQGGRIIINAFMANNVVILEIIDTGEGIPLDIDAFEPFMTTKKEGTGVGLVIVRQIVTAHDGKISYRSKPGEGTTFRLELPQRL